MSERTVSECSEILKRVCDTPYQSAATTRPLAEIPQALMYIGKCRRAAIRTVITGFHEEARMLDDIYNARILEFAGNIPRIGRLEYPQASATTHSRLCGSTVTVDLVVEDGKVVDYAHDVKACALGQASSSILANHIVGTPVGELRDLQKTMRAMLKDNGAPPQGRFADLKFLEPVRDYKARHASTLLAFDAVVDALDQIGADSESRAGNGAAA